MYAYLEVAVFEWAYRQGVVKVLGVAGVDGEGGDVAHVDALGHFLVGYARTDFVGGLLDVLRVFVGQAVFGQDGVHLGVVLAVASQYVLDLAEGRLLVFGPLGDAHDGLVAVLGALELLARDDDVGGEELRVGVQHTELLLEADSADEGLRVLLDNLGDDGLGFDAFAARGHGDGDLVAVEGVHGVALGHHDCLAVLVSDDGVLAVAAANEGAGGDDIALGALVFAGGNLEEVAVKGELCQIQGYGTLVGGDADAQCVRDLSVVVCVVLLLCDEVVHEETYCFGLLG